MIISFIIYVQSQIKSDPNEALLRVILYNLNKTALQDDVPEVPQRRNPSPALVVAQFFLLFALYLILFCGSLVIFAKVYEEAHPSSLVRRWFFMPFFYAQDMLLYLLLSVIFFCIALTLQMFSASLF